MTVRPGHSISETSLRVRRLEARGLARRWRTRDKPAAPGRRGPCGRLSGRRGPPGKSAGPSQNRARWSRSHPQECDQRRSCGTPRPRGASRRLRHGRSSPRPSGTSSPRTPPGRASAGRRSPSPLPPTGRSHPGSPPPADRTAAQLVHVRRQVRRTALRVLRLLGRVVGRVLDELLDEVRPEKHLRALRRHRDLDHLRGRRRHPQLAQHRQEDVVVLLILLEGQVLAGEHAGRKPDAEGPVVVRPARDPELNHGDQHVREVFPVGLAVLDAEHHPAAAPARRSGRRREQA